MALVQEARLGGVWNLQETNGKISNYVCVNQQLKVLDKHHQEVAPGKLGEIAIKGACGGNFYFKKKR